MFSYTYESNIFKSKGVVKLSGRRFMDSAGPEATLKVLTRQLRKDYLTTMHLYVSVHGTLL